MFSIACILLASLCVVDTSTIMRCSVNATFHFVEDQTPNITCSGFPVGYWSLTGPPTGGQELRIGDCSKCGSGGACSCITHSTDYNITRNGDNSTLFFVDNLSGNNRSTITCSNDNTCFTSTINIIKAPVRCQHASNCIEIVEDQPTPITCPGAQDKDIYWSVTRPSTRETTIGNCSKCATQTHLPCTCHSHNGDYSITRTGDTTTAVSILLFVNNVATNDNSTIKCSAPEDNQTLVSVSIKVIPAYRLPACNNNKVALYENSNRRIRCEGMELSQDMYWSITYPNMTEHTVAVCGNCENETCPQCNVSIDDFSVERNQTFSVLRMTAGNDRDKEGAVVKCSKLNNATNDQCQLSIRYDDPEPFPWVVVGVAVGAIVLVITIVIAIVVVVARRRASRKRADKHSTEANSADDEFEEHINDLYQSSDLDTPPLPDQCTPASAQQAFHLQPLQASSAPRVSSTESSDTNGIQEVTKTAQPEDVYNELGSTPRGDQKADAVYNHLTKF